MLGDKQILTVIKPFSEVVKCNTHLSADIGDQLFVKHQRLTTAPERSERLALEWRQP
jgi:hypothetical protein